MELLTVQCEEENVNEETRYLENFQREEELCRRPARKCGSDWLGWEALLWVGWSGRALLRRWMVKQIPDIWGRF